MSDERTAGNTPRDVYSSLVFLEKRIERARQGDKAAALRLLLAVKELLEAGSRIPPPLGAYLAECIGAIEKAADPGRVAGRALNLTREGKEQDITKTLRNDKIVLDLKEQLSIETGKPSPKALRGEKSPLDRAISAVAKSHGLSERQIYRIVQPYLASHEDR